MNEPLPQLLDAKALQGELGVTRASAEAIMRRLPVVQIEGLRKTFVRRSAVAAYLDERTFEKDEVPNRRTQMHDSSSRAPSRGRGTQRSARGSAARYGRGG